MPRFYCPHDMSTGSVVNLPENVAHHLRVLRLGPGDSFTLFNGKGGEFTAVLSTIDKKSALAEVSKFLPREAELSYSVTLAQGLPEAAKMDWIIEKAVELGVSAIQPLSAQRCVVKLSGERAQKKTHHWQSVIIAASEQCGRNRLAELAEPSDYTHWIKQKSQHVRILLSPRATMPLSTWARQQPPQAISFVIGPEGGFNENEENLAIAQGAIALSMGPRILRTETAGLAALATINAAWEGL